MFSALAESRWVLPTLLRPATGPGPVIPFSSQILGLEVGVHLGAEIVLAFRLALVGSL